MPDAPLIPDSIGSAVDRRGVGARRWWALGALVMGGVAVGLDATVLSVALPTLARKLHASESDLQWFSSGYLLVLAAAMLPLGLLGDRYGRKRVLLGSFALFAVGSAACAASPSSSAFIAARVLLGLAGAGVTVMGFATLPVLFGEEERPRAVGMMAAATFVSLPLGPILGGLAVDPLLVGVGVPDQCAGLSGGHGRDLRAGAGVTRARAARSGPRRGGPVDPRLGRGDLRADPGRRARLEQRGRCAGDGLRCGGADRILASGSSGSAADRVVSRCWISRCFVCRPTPGG